MEERITSSQNSRIKNLVRLRDGKHRRRQGLYIIEGLRELERAIACGVVPIELYVCEELWNDDGALDLTEQVSGMEGTLVLNVAEEPFKKASARENPDGLIAVAKVPELGIRDLKLSSNPFLLIVEHVEKPGNLGTLLRTADAAGVDAVIITDPVTDIYSPNAIRASQGSIFSIPSVVVSNEELRGWLAGNGISVVATTPENAQVHWNVDFTGPVALLMGSEARGLSKFWLDDEAVLRALIPMRGQADSLNVSAAAAIFLFEAVRQRSARLQK